MAYRDSIIERIYDLRMALREISNVEPARMPAELARRALALDERARDQAALDLAVHAEDVAVRAGLKALD